MNAVDRMLAATADFLEAQIIADPDLKHDLEMLFAHDMHPAITRRLSGFRQAEAVIVLGTRTDAR
jgi:hypothetical protein